MAARSTARRRAGHRRGKSVRRRGRVARRHAGGWLRRQDKFTRRLLVAVAALSLLIVALVVPRIGEQRPPVRSARTFEPTAARPAPAPARRPARTRTAPAQTSAATAVPARATAPPEKNALPGVAAESAPAPPVTPPPAAAPQAAATPKPLPPAQRTAARSSGTATAPRAAIVIDDLGQSFAHFEQLAELRLPLTVAVIPGLPATARTVKAAERLGIEMLLHQPMEPLEQTGKNAGEGVLTSAMDAEALRARIRTSLAEVPGAVGANNHMGSRFTEDEAALGAVMAELAEHGLFWLDSRTSPASRGGAAARAAGVPEIGRDIFLDAEVDPEYIRGQVRKFIGIARVRGTAVGIGHPHPQTIAVLRELRDELLASGVTLVPVSALVRRRPPARTGPALAATAATAAAPKKPAGPAPALATQ